MMPMRPGLSVRNGMTNASREIPSASVMEKICSISLSVTAFNITWRSLRPSLHKSATV